ncbi:hypothetical protein EAG_13283 [Camponotus floridanus]|uniref:Uncharacterized protein n=1 Tax=Camponotus floridanus TaxID=104421 RepID=E2AT20_CAMFO|nr:hypothetical protein EAG_13283 [Camponotus floridanus]
MEVDDESNDEASASRSAKKLKSSADDIIISQSFGYRIIEFVSVFSALADILVCKQCKRKVSFGQSVDYKRLGIPRRKSKESTLNSCSAAIF